MQQAESRDFSDLDRGWSWMVLFAASCINLILGGLSNTIGITHSVLLEKYGESVALTSWAGSLYSSLLFLGGPLSSAVADRFSCRMALVTSGLLLTAGFLGTAFAQNIITAIVTCGIIGGIGGGIGITANLVVIGFNFKKKRNLALGVSLSAVGIGVFVFAPLIEAGREYYGVFGFFIILAAVAANMVTCGMLCFPSQLERHTKLERTRHRQRVSQSSTRNECSAMIRTYLTVLKNRGVILMCSSFFVFSIGSYIVYLHLPHYIKSKGQSGRSAAFLVGLTGIMSTFSRIVTGIVANTGKIDEVVIYSVTIAIFGASTLVYPFISGYYSGHVVYVIFVGLFYGCCNVVFAGVHVKYIGINYISSAIGLQYFAGGVGGMAGPVFAGLLVDLGGTYEQSFIVAACCVLTSALIGSILICVPKTPIVQEPPVDNEVDEECQSKFVVNSEDNVVNGVICLQDLGETPG